MGNKIKVLWCGDGGCATGFARVNHSIINNLPKDKYEVHHLAINYHGDPCPEATVPMYPAALGGDLYGFGRIQSLYKKIKPDIVFILNDIWVMPQYLELLPENAKIVSYFPVDAEPLDVTWCEQVIKRTVPVAYTKFARNAVLRVIPEATVRIIPHGVDTDKFYPVEISEARENLDGINEDDFIVLNANRNQPRKRIDLTIKGFAKFAANKPNNVKLYCHMGIEDAGFHILYLCTRYGITDRLALTALELSPTNYVDDTRMNWIYNSCDIGLNSSMGEGWGLPTFEHAACKRAQIVPNSSACAELYQGIAQLMPIDHYDIYPRILTEGAVVNENSIAASLEYYYTNPDARQKDAEAIYNFVTQPKFNWQNIALKWDRLFENLL